MKRIEIVELPYNQEDIDIEIRNLVNVLNIGGISTVSCCSGHSKEFGHIWLKDGRVLIILPQGMTKEEICLKLAI